MQRERVISSSFSKHINHYFQERHSICWNLFRRRTSSIQTCIYGDIWKMLKSSEILYFKIQSTFWIWTGRKNEKQDNTLLWQTVWEVPWSRIQKIIKKSWIPLPVSHFPQNRPKSHISARSRIEILIVQCYEKYKMDKKMGIFFQTSLSPVVYCPSFVKCS